MTHIQVRSLLDSVKIVSGTQLQCPPPTKISYKSPYLLLHNNQQAQIFLVDDENGFLVLKQMYTISSPGVATDIFVYNVKKFSIIKRIIVYCRMSVISCKQKSMDNALITQSPLQ